VENLKSKPLESSGAEQQKYFKNYFKRHVAAVLLSLLASFGVPQKGLEAREQQTATSADRERGTVEAERRQALEDFKKLVDQEKIEEKIAEIVKVFGLAASDLLITRRAYGDVKNMVELYAKKDNPSSFTHPDGPQFLTLGNIVANAYKERWQYHKQPERPVAFNNIDSVPGLSIAELEIFINTTYPKGYVSSSILSIEFTGKSDIRSNENAEVLGQVESFGLGTILRSKTDGDFRLPVKVNMPQAGINKAEFLDVLEHEISHGFDPENNSVLNSAERVSMLLEIYSRSIAPDRFISPYVESITLNELAIYFKNTSTAQSEGAQKQYLAYIRTNEYWAEIHKAYFQKPVELEKTNPADYALVKKWVEATRK